MVLIDFFIIEWYDNHLSISVNVNDEPQSVSIYTVDYELFATAAATFFIGAVC